MAKLLHELTGTKEWHWGVEQWEAFEELKKIITSAPLLQMPRDDCHLRVEANSSNFATGAVLSQEVDGKWYPITFMSKLLNEVERNYVIYDKELLAIVRALEEWSQYLKGAQYPVSILTDHQNLKYFQTA